MKTSLFKSLYFQVLTAIAIGILLGHYYPELGAQMKPLGDAFVKLIKMVIAPVIFCTVVTGIAGMESMKAVGRTGAVALLYFEVVSTLALIIGLIIVNVVQPGAGMNVDPSTLDAKAVAVYADQAKDQGVVALPIHDCILVGEHRLGVAKRALEEASAAVLGQCLTVEVEEASPRGFLGPPEVILTPSPLVGGASQ